MTAGMRLIQVTVQFKILNALRACDSLCHPLEVSETEVFF